MRRVFFVLMLAAVAAFLATLSFALLPTTTRAISPAAATPGDAVMVEEGRYPAAAGDCVACHTVAGGQPFGGGLAMVSPIGVVYSSNITPDLDTGIGEYSLN